MPFNCIFKIVKMTNFVLCVFLLPIHAQKEEETKTKQELGALMPKEAITGTVTLTTVRT